MSQLILAGGLSDDILNLKKYQIASDTILPANGFLLFTQAMNFGVGANDSGNLAGFGLSEYGETIYLSSGSSGELNGKTTVFLNRLAHHLMEYLWVDLNQQML